MKRGIIGYISLLIGLTIFVLIFIITQVRVIEKGQDTQTQAENAKGQIDKIQQNLNDQNKKLENLQEQNQ